MKVEVTTWHLEMLSPEALKPKGPPVEDLRVEIVSKPDPVLNHFFFVEVGRRWRWYSRLQWTFEKWQAHVNRPEVITGVGYFGGEKFGYFELEDRGGDVEVVFFGVLERFTGKRLGGFLLTEMVRRACSNGASRVWLHTCSEDHPAALAFYKKHGFEVFKEETKIEEIPDPDDPVWLTPAYKHPSR